jgi:mediator of RNA polymerase II transcription subunit 10
MPPRPPPLVPILVPTPAPDSPRSAQSVPPTGIQGDLEQDLMGFANALYNLGTTVVNDSTKDPGTGKQVGLRVCVLALHSPQTQFLIPPSRCGRNEVVGYLGGLDDMASHLTTRVPMQVLTDIDNGRNPMHLTKDRLERAATENQFMNAKIKAIEVCICVCAFQDGPDVGK